MLFLCNDSHHSNDGDDITRVVKLTKENRTIKLVQTPFEVPDEILVLLGRVPLLVFFGLTYQRHIRVHSQSTVQDLVD